MAELKCPVAEDCALRRVLRSKPDARDDVVNAAQQIRYVYRDAGALSGLLDGLQGDEDASRELDGTLRISRVALTCAQNLADRIRDKTAVVAQIVVILDWLSNGGGLWEQLDNGE